MDLMPLNLFLMFSSGAEMLTKTENTNVAGPKNPVMQSLLPSSQVQYGLDTILRDKPLDILVRGIVYIAV